ncbi:helix-turn-helix domain-containing protein [Paenibacillus marinisediminis]
MNNRKQKILMDKIDTHLRMTARKMIQFDTLDEALHYLIDSFYSKFPYDYMAIVTVDHTLLRLKVTKGAAPRFAACFPLAVQDCMPRIFQESLTSFDVIQQWESCKLLTSLADEQFQTWFTIPIQREEEGSLGLCVIGYRHFVPLLLEADKLFEEYGKDLATLFALVQQKEYELKRVKGLEWLKENMNLDGSSLEKIVESIVERAGKGTVARAAGLYLYDESTNSLLLQSPFYGQLSLPKTIELKEIYNLNAFFAYLDTIGGHELTIPLMNNIRTLGVLHVESGEEAVFSGDDLKLLQFLASHVSALIENVRLYVNEKDQKYRLEKFMQHQQQMVKHMLEDHGFAKISDFLSQMLNCSVILFDRFFHIACHTILETDEPMKSPLLLEIEKQKKRLQKSMQPEYWIAENGQLEAGIWKVVGGGEILGYLGLIIARSKLDIVLRMTLNHALNVYAVQFIKQKAVLDVREQVKDSFFNQLFAKNYESIEEIRENANLLNWNINEPHSIGLFAFEFTAEDQKLDLIEINTQKNRIWERIRDYLTRAEPRIVLTRKEGFFIAIVPQEINKGDYWKSLYGRIQKIVQAEFDHVDIFVGVSQEALHIEDYYLCYKQAHTTLTIVCNRFRDIGLLSFHQLGSYSVLYHLGDPLAVPLFLNTYLEPLLQHGNGKTRDLFNTLREYLQSNGSIKDTAEQLYIHRSSLKYRLEKIRELLKIDIDNAEQRFNLMLAFKLHDLFHTELQME